MACRNAGNIRKDKVKKMKIRALLRDHLSYWFTRLYVRVWLNRWRKINACRDVREIFTRVYSSNEWGGAPGEFYSGPGSEDPAVATYAEIVRNFIKDHRISSVVDLGCGDFRVGSQLQVPGVKYLGLDIVQSLVDRNQSRFGGTDISFGCRDIIKDRLPEAELCLIRQVLQHLSNQEISQILNKVNMYRYVIITEHRLPAYIKAVPNRDKAHGPDTRMSDRSGVYPESPPFNVKISAVLQDTEMQDYECFKGERLVTFLILPQESNASGENSVQRVSLQLTF